MDQRSFLDLMAASARELQRQRDPHETFAAAVEIARREIDGCDAAALSLISGRTVKTTASTSAAARRCDELQYETGEGPCLEAIRERHTVHSPDLGVDARWPVWGPRVAEEVGYHSTLAFQLFTSHSDVGALNLYSSHPDGFDTDDREHGLALAAHIAVAIRSAQLIEGLDTALASRTVIGKALGIVMERYGLGDDAAFALLSRLSSATNRKLRDLAADVVATRQLPDGPSTGGR